MDVLVCPNAFVSFVSFVVKALRSWRESSWILAAGRSPTAVFDSSRQFRKSVDENAHALVVIRHTGLQREPGMRLLPLQNDGIDCPAILQSSSNALDQRTDALPGPGIQIK